MDRIVLQVYDIRIITPIINCRCEIMYDEWVKMKGGGGRMV